MLSRQTAKVLYYNNSIPFNHTTLQDRICKDTIATDEFSTIPFPRVLFYGPGLSWQIPCLF